MNEKCKKILEKCDSMGMLDESITDKDTFKRVSDHLKDQGWYAITFKVHLTKSLAVAKMIELAMLEGWGLDALYVRDGLILGALYVREGCVCK